MAAQKGKLVLIKIGDGGSGSESFTTIAGLRTNSMSLNKELVDITTKDDSNYRQGLAGGGLKTVSVSGSGVFKDAAVDETIRAQFDNDATFANFSLIVPNFGSFIGPFEITQLDYAGEFNGEATYSMTLESAGDISFVAES